MINEAQLEQLVIQWFQDRGWSYTHGPDIAPEGAAQERSDLIACINGLPLFNDPHPVVSFESFGGNAGGHQPLRRRLRRLAHVPGGHRRLNSRHSGGKGASRHCGGERVSVLGPGPKTGNEHSWIAMMILYQEFTLVRPHPLHRQPRRRSAGECPSAMVPALRDWRALFVCWDDHRRRPP